MKSFALLCAGILLSAGSLSAQRSVDKVRLTETFSLLNGRLKMLFPEYSELVQEQPTFFEPADMNVSDYSATVSCPGFSRKMGRVFQVRISVDDMLAYCTRDEFKSVAKRVNYLMPDSTTDEMFENAGFQCLLMSPVRPPGPESITVLNQMVVRAPDSSLYRITAYQYWSNVGNGDFFVAQQYAARILKTISRGERRTDLSAKKRAMTLPGSALRIGYFVPDSMACITVDQTYRKMIKFIGYTWDTARENRSLAIFFETSQDPFGCFLGSEFFGLLEGGGSAPDYTKLDVRDSGVFMNKPFQWSAYRTGNGQYLFGAMLENVEGRKFVLEAWLNSKEELEQMSEILKSFHIQK